jgi:hypothetical protein
VQDFLDSLAYRCDDRFPATIESYRSRTAHCFDGALLAAAILRRNGIKCGLINLHAERDDDHLLCVFEHKSRLGAIAQSNFPGLRYREPIFRSARELALSYFEFYFDLKFQKSLRALSVPLWLASKPPYAWESDESEVESLAVRLAGRRRIVLITPRQVVSLSPIDERLRRSHMVGVKVAGVSREYR